MKYTTGKAHMCFLRSILRRANSAAQRLDHTIMHRPALSPRWFQSRSSYFTHDPNSSPLMLIPPPHPSNMISIVSFRFICITIMPILFLVLHIFAVLCALWQLQRFLLLPDPPFPAELAHHISCHVLHSPTVFPLCFHPSPLVLDESSSRPTAADL